MKTLKVKNIGRIIRRDEAGVQVNTSAFLCLHKHRKNHYITQRIGDNQYRKFRVESDDVDFLMSENLGAWSVLLPIECPFFNIEAPEKGFALLVQDAEL